MRCLCARAAKAALAVESLGERHFRLAPYPFAASPLVF